MWTFTIISAIAAAIVIKVVMGDVYDPAAMQRLYNLTPIVVIGSALLGVLGIEKRRTKAELAALLAASQQVTPAGNALRAASTLLRENTQVRTFFAFMFLSILAIFMQDTILEVFGADVFGMGIKETTSFTQTWGAGVLGGMILAGALSSVFPISKKLLETVGGAGTALGLGLLTLCAFTGQRSLLSPAILLMGLATGLFNVGALSLMMSMTLEGATGLYMGLWGMAQAFGTGGAAVVSGALKTALIETGLLSSSVGYAAIFGLETVLMLVAVAILRGISVNVFKGVSQDDLVRSMEASAVV